MRRTGTVHLGTILVVILGTAISLWAQGPAGGGPVPGGPGMPRAGMPGPGGASWWEGPWWSGPFVEDLNLSDSQKADIRAAVREYRDKIVEIRGNIQKADADVEAAFGENPVDQRKASDAIERLAAARGDLTRTLSLMSLKIRGILTPEQWQELQRRQPGRRGERGFRGGPFGRGRGTGAPSYGGPGNSLTKQ